VSILVALDRGQRERALREAIRDGRLPADARLPSSRGLAAEGYLQTRQGAPVRVAHGVRAQPARPPAPVATGAVRL
jgi:DNA-binding FadR family transcriptional regulator